jgi:hypothetical protein
MNTPPRSIGTSSARASSPRQSSAPCAPASRTCYTAPGPRGTTPSWHVEPTCHYLSPYLSFACSRACSRTFSRLLSRLLSPALSPALSLALSPALSPALSVALRYILWWSLDYLSICLAILASSLVYGRFAFYCAPPLQLLFITSALGLLSTTLVAVLAVASSALRATSFLLFVVFCNGVPLLYMLAARLLPPNDPAHPPTPHVDSAYLALWGGSLGAFVLGLVTKSSSLPERAAASRWTELLLSSHALWHILLSAHATLPLAPPPLRHHPILTSPSSPSRDASAATPTPRHQTPPRDASPARATSPSSSHRQPNPNL